MNSLNKPIKRIGALLTILGMGVLLGSLSTWALSGKRGQRIYYIELYSSWKITDAPSLPVTLATDTLWQFDEACLAPHQPPPSYSPFASVRPSSIREGEAIKLAGDPSWLARTFANEEVSDTRTPQQKTIDGLASFVLLSTSSRE